MALRAHRGQCIDINQPTEDLDIKNTTIEDNEATVETHVTQHSDVNENMRNPGNNGYY